MLLSWFPGPDGGHDQTFTVRNRKRGDEIYILYKDGIRDTKHANITEKVTMLLPETQYEFHVTAHNVVGQSEAAFIRVKTRGTLNSQYTYIYNNNNNTFLCSAIFF